MSKTNDLDDGLQVGVWECGCVGFPQITNGRGESLVLEACDDESSRHCEYPVTNVSPFWRDLTKKKWEFSSEKHHIKAFKDLLKFFWAGVRAFELLELQDRVADWQDRQRKNYEDGKR